MLRKLIQASAKKVASITKATCALHNHLMIEEFGIPNQSKRYCPAGFIDAEDRCVEYHWVVPENIHTPHKGNLKYPLSPSPNILQMSNLPHSGHLSSKLPPALGHSLFNLFLV